MVRPIVVVVFVCLLTTPAIEAATVHLGSCSGTEIDFNSAKAACNSGDFAGQTIVRCSNKGKLKDRRICNSDGATSGVYVGSCAGTATDESNLRKACETGSFDGLLLVRCRKGEEKDRQQCASAESDDDRVVLFVDRCGGSDTVEGRDLKKACRANPGETLVKCRRTGSTWKEKKAMHCDGRRDRFKFKDCSLDERITLIDDYGLAEERVDIVLAEIEAELASNADHDANMRRKLETVRKKFEKIQTAMDRPRTYVCRANRNLCARANAHTMSTGANVKVCDGYFDRPTALERASIIVHEISHHKVGTNDKGNEHGGCVDPNLSRAANAFEKQAEYFEHLAECGFYVPS